MKNSKRMMAVIAASGLALGSMPGVASAQSVEAGLGLGLAAGSVALGLGIGLEAGSAGDVPGSSAITGSLDKVTGSAEGDNGSLKGDSLDKLTGSAGKGSSDNGSGTILALGSLAGAGIGIGIIVAGGVNLPPLPEINVGMVCNLPPEAVDFLKDNGSMKQEECEPEEPTEALT